MGRTRDFTVDVVEPLPPVDGDPARYTLLTKETVLMTVLAQDPSVVDRGGPVRAGLAVPAERLQRGPRGHRFHVVDVNVGNGRAAPPVVLHDGDGWTYRDGFTADAHPAGRLLREAAFTLVAAGRDEIRADLLARMTAPRETDVPGI